VALLHVGSGAGLGHLVNALRQGLRDSGYEDGRNMILELRWADGRYDRLPALANELVQRKVDVIVTGGGEASAHAAKNATASIPIVFNIGNDPVQVGLVASLGRPGGNITGVNIFTAEIAAKRLGLLHEFLPAGATVALLVNPNFPQTATNIVEVEAAAAKLGRQVLLFRATSAAEIDAAFAELSQAQAKALLVGADSFFYSRRQQLVELALRYRIPAVYEQREFVLDGGLMSYGTKIIESYRQMGVYAGNILKGAKPADLPVVQLSKFELLINVKTARALNLAIPSGMMAIADEVVE